MITVAYGDISPLLKNETFRLFFDKLEENAKQRICEMPRKEHRAYRLMEQIMLEALFRKEFFKSLPEIRVTALGKPYFEEGPAFSISHDRNLVAIAMSTDFAQIGVDIQSQPNPVTASRVRRRFLTPIPPYRKGSPDLIFLMAHIEKDGVDLTPAHAFGTPSTFLCDYVRAEAVMKQNGGGFADFPRLHALCAECETAILPLGDVAIGLSFR